MDWSPLGPHYENPSSIEDMNGEDSNYHDSHCINEENQDKVLLEDTEFFNACEYVEVVLPVSKAKSCSREFQKNLTLVDHSGVSVG